MGECGCYHHHAEFEMSSIMWSSRSCRAVHASEDIATVFCVLARHDPEVRKLCSTTIQKQEILSEEDEKIYNMPLAGCILRHFVRSLDVFAPFPATKAVTLCSGSCSAVLTGDAHEC